MTLDVGPCTPWTPIWSCDISTYAPQLTGQAVDFATRIVWALSGRQYGTCPVTLRPCVPNNFQPFPGVMLAYPWATYGMPSTVAAWDASYWFPYGCGGTCSDSCSCSIVPEIQLPAAVNQITAVKVDGSVLAPTAYRLDNHRLLVRTDGSLWPRCNDLTLDDTKAGTWSVTADYGQDVPVGGQLAVGEMACQILRAMSGGDCQLPNNVTSLIRQGVTITYPTIQELLGEGRTGLYLTDLFLATSNPNKLNTRARVYRIDGAPPRRAGS